MEAVTDFTFLGSKITVDSDCSHEIERHLLLGRKTVTNLDSILKSRDITLPTKVHIVKAMAFPVVMYGCESWTIKKAEHQRIDAFKLWCWKKLFRVPWTARRSNQSILKEINPEYSMEGRMLKFQYFGHLMQRAESLEKTLMLGKTEGKRGRQKMRWFRTSKLVGHQFEQTPGDNEGQESLACCSPRGHKSRCSNLNINTQTHTQQSICIFKLSSSTQSCNSFILVAEILKLLTNIYVLSIIHGLSITCNQPLT